MGSYFLTTGDTSFIPQTIIDGSNSLSVISIDSCSAFKNQLVGFTIRSGNAILGGGIYCVNSEIVIRHNYIVNNSAGNAAGIHVENCDNSEIYLNDISNNIAGERGGGLNATNNDNLRITKNIISDNYAYALNWGSGGGMQCTNNTNLLIANNIIRNNRASGSQAANGGGISTIGNLNLLIYNNIIRNNVATSGTPAEGGGISCFDSPAIEIMNSIIYGNTPNQVFQLFPQIIKYCDVEDGLAGEGNIDVNPLFRDPENGDFHLMSIACGDSIDSPCIDAGDPIIEDYLLDCSWGLGGLRSDIGAYGGGDSTIVGIIDENEDYLPQTFILNQNYPNPFNNQTIISYNLDELSNVSLTIFDITGKEVKRLVKEEYQSAGHYSYIWDGVNGNSESVSTAIYIFRLSVNNKSTTKNMILLR